MYDRLTETRATSSAEPATIARSADAPPLAAIEGGPSAARLRVLFMQSVPHTSTPFYVHTSLMQCFDHRTVDIHVAYNRRAAGELPATETSVLPVLRGIPDVRLRAVEFGPRVGGVPRHEVVVRTLPAVVPAARDAVGLARYIRRAGIPVIQCAEAPRDVFYALCLARATSTKCVMHMHAKYGDWINPLSRWAMHRADGVISISDWACRHVIDAGVPSQRVFRVYNGIDVARWNPDLARGDAIRREFGIGPDTGLVAIVGNIHPWKGHLTLVEAFRAVVQTHPDVKLMIVGREERAASGGHTAAVKELVEKAQLQRHVIFTGQRSDVPEILATADIFAMPAFEEPFGNVFVEAMAMRTPVVALRSGGTPEIVEDGQAGLLSNPDDAEQLAANIVTLLRDPERRQKMGVYGRRRVLERFTTRHMADGAEQVYRVVAGVRPD
jgi:glycosyltransferase involved in cell wall biosynthesis